MGKYKLHKIGEFKVENKFLFMPLSLGGKAKWLQYAKIKYIYVAYFTKSYNKESRKYGWIPIEWVE